MKGGRRTERRKSQTGKIWKREKEEKKNIMEKR